MKIQTWRLNDTFGYLFLLGAGTAFGITVGHLFVAIIEAILNLRTVELIVTHPQLYAFIERTVVENGYSVSELTEGLDEVYAELELVFETIHAQRLIISMCYRFFEGVGALWFSYPLAKAQGLYYDLFRLKEKHRFTLFSVRHLNPVVFNPFMDMVWAISYILAEHYAPFLVSVVLGGLTFLLLWPSIGIFAGIPAVVMMLWMPQHTKILVRKLFGRHDLEYEIETAPMKIAALAQLDLEGRVLDEREAIAGWDERPIKKMPAAKKSSRSLIRFLKGRKS